MTSRTTTPVLLAHVARRPRVVPNPARFGVLRRLFERARSLARADRATAPQREREALRLSVWALGYSGLAREAARLFQQDRGEARARGPL